MLHRKTSNQGPPWPGRQYIFGMPSVLGVCIGAGLAPDRHDDILGRHHVNCFGVEVTVPAVMARCRNVALQHMSIPPSVLAPSAPSSAGRASHCGRAPSSHRLQPAVDQGSHREQQDLSCRAIQGLLLFQDNPAKHGIPDSPVTGCRNDNFVLSSQQLIEPLQTCRGYVDPSRRSGPAVLLKNDLGEGAVDVHFYNASHDGSPS